ncbi:MAG: hypothetical protein ACJAX4_003596 [Clostridium sp.]|jgi:hypothetical protein
MQKAESSFIKLDMAISVAATLTLAALIIPVLFI